MRPPPMSTSPQKQEEAGGTPPEVLWCISLYEVITSKDQPRKQGKPMQQCHWWRPDSAKPKEDQQRVPRQNQCKNTVHCLLGSTYTLSKHMFLKRLLHQNTTHPFMRQLPGKHLVSVLSKTSSHKTVSRKKKITWNNWVSNQTRNSHFNNVCLVAFDCH